MKLEQRMKLECTAKRSHIVRQWDEIYRKDEMRWGAGPSVTARLAGALRSRWSLRQSDIVEVGCGYGRDVVYLSGVFDESRVVGIEPSVRAGELFSRLLREKSIAEPGPVNVDFKLCDYFALSRDFGFRKQVGMVFSNYLSNVLEAGDFDEMIQISYAITRRGGLFVSSFVSPQDATYLAGERLSARQRSVNGVVWTSYDVKEATEIVERHGYKVLVVNEMKEEATKCGKADDVDMVYVAARRI